MRVRLLLLVFSIILFTHCSSEKDTTSSLLNLIPENSFVVIKINDLDTFRSDLEENDIISKIQNSEPIEELANRFKPLKYIDSEQNGLLAILDHPKNDFDFVYISQDSLLEVTMDSSLNKTVETIARNDLKFEKYDIDGSSLYASTIQDKKIIGSSLLAIEKVLEHWQDGKVHGQFEQFHKFDSPSKSAQVWVDLRNGKNLFQKLLGMDTVENPNYADWLSLDVTLDSNEIILNGIAISKDSTQNYLGLFSDTKPLANHTMELTPNDVDSYTSFTFNQFRDFSKNQERFLKEDHKKDSLFSAVEEIGVATLNNEKVILLKTYGTANITDYLNGLKTNSIEFQGSEIWELKSDSLLSQSFYPIIKGFAPSYSTIIENTFAFSKKQETLERFITANKMGQSLDKTLIFDNIRDMTTSESTILSVANTNGFQNNLEMTNLGALAGIFKKADLSGYLLGSQIISDAGFLHANYFVKKIAESGNRTGVSEVFKLQLDSDVSLNPQFFTNHRTNRKDIVVQDQDNALYLISNKGKIIWKKELESAVQGKIHEVDIYRNGKYQLAFTTNNRFYIIDRNGKEVAPFTFKYEGGNLNPLAVFDYSGNKNYRFVVTQDNKVFMYNNDGKIVSGFKYTKAEDTILGTPQHFVIGTRDYIVFRLANGSLKILNRVGNVRVKIPEKISFSENEVKVHQNKFLITSKDGILYEIDTKGKIGKSDLQLHADHGFDATSRTLVIMDDNILSIREKKVTLDLGVYTRPAIFYLNDKIYVSVTDIQNLKSYLYDSQAEPITGFPVLGSSTADMADMDNDNKPELVIKDQENSIIVYKVN